MNQMRRPLNEIELILVQRDGYSEADAQTHYEGFLEACHELEDPHEIEELLMTDLGLEPDYVMQVLFDMTPPIKS